MTDPRREDWYRGHDAPTEPQPAAPTGPQAALPGQFPAVPDDPYRHMAAHPGTGTAGTSPAWYALPEPQTGKIRTGRGPALLAVALAFAALAVAAYAVTRPLGPYPPAHPAPASVCVHFDRHTGFLKGLTAPAAGKCAGSSRLFRIP